MALVPFTGQHGARIYAFPSEHNESATSSIIIDAVGESVAFIGRVRIEGGGSKTLSGAGGGSIYWRAGTVTFADAGTTFRIGLQDVATTGLEDGTFDVNVDFIGGGGGITTSAANKSVMTTGSKTVAHGDVIAICFEMIARGGADSVAVGHHTLSLGAQINTQFPYRTSDAGAGPAKGSGTVAATILFDDGSFGWIDPEPLVANFLTNTSSFTYGNASASDEYAAIIRLPFKCSINGFMQSMSAIASADTFEINIYEDAFGTPASLITQTPDPDILGLATASNYYVHLPTSIELEKDVWYAFAFKATAAGTISFSYYNMASGNEIFKRLLPFGADIKVGSRADGTGAFVETQVYHMPAFGLLIDKLDDGVQVGGQSSYTFGG